MSEQQFAPPTPRASVSSIIWTAGLSLALFIVGSVLVGAILFSFTVSQVVGAVMGSGPMEFDAAEDTSVGDRTVSVVMETTGDADGSGQLEASVYSTLTEQSFSLPDVPFPYREEFDIRTGGDARTKLKIIADSPADSTSFGCRITVDGVVVDEMTTSGAGATATCSAVDGD